MTSASVRCRGSGPFSTKSRIVSTPLENCVARVLHWLVTEVTT